MLNTHPSHVVALATSLILSACSTSPPWVRPSESQRTISVRPSLHPYALANDVVAYGASDITHLTLAIYALDEQGQPNPVLAVGDLPDDGNMGAARVTFSNLHHSTTYRIVATAYGVDPDNHPLVLTRPDDTSQVDVPLDAQEQDAAAAGPIVVPVNLIPKVFDAKATSPQGITITAGTVSPVPFTP